MNIRNSKLARMGAAALVLGGLLIGALTGAASAAGLDRFGPPTGRRDRPGGENYLEHDGRFVGCD